MIKKNDEYVLGQDNVKVFGMDIHNPVFILSLIVIVVFIFFSITYPNSEKLFEDLRKNITNNFDWFFLLSGNIFVIFCIGLILSPFGKIRIGGQNAKPEFSRLSWFSMLFAAGMGIGLMFWSVSEPVVYGAGVWGHTPLGVNNEEMAFATTIFHWGLHPWAIYSIVALALAFFCYNKKLPLTIRSAFYPIFGESVWGWVGHVIDIIAVFATIFGLATSLGLGAKQVSSGLNFVFGIADNNTTKTLLILFITALAVVSVILGIKKGVKRLSEINIVVAVLLLLLVIVLGPTLDIVKGFFINSYYYVKNIIPLSNFVGREDIPVMREWTSFYWAWWIAWSPFVGMFIARVSKGRTIREFIISVLFIPTIFTIIWMSSFGGAAIDTIKKEAGNLDDVIVKVTEKKDGKEVSTNKFNSKLAKEVNNEKYEKAMFIMFQESFPFSKILSFIAIFLIIVFFVTSSDSGSLVIDSITSGGKIDSPVVQRVVWSSLEGLVAIALLLGGGLVALQAASIATGLPFAVILLFMCISIYIGLNDEYKNLSLISIIKKICWKNILVLL